MEYIAKLEKEGDNVLVTFPDIPGCNTFGESTDDALKMASEALDLMLETKLEDKDPLPESTLKEDKKNGLYAIQVRGSLALAYTIFEARRGKSAASL